MFFPELSLLQNSTSNKLNLGVLQGFLEELVQLDLIGLKSVDTTPQGSERVMTNGSVFFKFNDFSDSTFQRIGLDPVLVSEPFLRYFSFAYNQSIDFLRKRLVFQNCFVRYVTYNRLLEVQRRKLHRSFIEKLGVNPIRKEVSEERAKSLKFILYHHALSSAETRYSEIVRPPT